MTMRTTIATWIQIGFAAAALSACSASDTIAPAVQAESSGLELACVHAGSNAGPWNGQCRLLGRSETLTCLSSETATVVDSDGVSHTDTLANLVALATGLGCEGLTQVEGRPCQADAYDCKGAGPPVDANGGPLTDADVAAWLEQLATFYAQKVPRLSLGKRKVCMAWARQYFKNDAHRDASILAVMQTLQNIGGEYVVAQDAPLLTRVIRASDACSVPEPPGNNLENSWWIPPHEARSFYRQFRNCDAAAAADPIGCEPGAFTGPNHVNAFFLLDAIAPPRKPSPPSLELFAGDPSGGCGAKCYCTYDCGP